MSQSGQSAVHDGLELYISPCVNCPPHPFHPPSSDRPIRIRIQGPLETIEKLLPNESWYPLMPFPQPGGLELASLTHQRLYGQRGDAVLAVRDEYLACVIKAGIPQDYIDYYGVTFDHLVPKDDPNPEVLVINIIEVDDGEGMYADGGQFANELLLFPVNPTDYTGRRVLAVPRCCQKKKGTQDRRLINSQVAERDVELRASS
ncbi:hypothetical protein GGR56DRAFT_649360 [Xylariaceae sp. FL0804]|nr:hypothetical protein GGR56DRAFT_649360 [Xylariaceae sp. FL0804]